MNKQTNKPTTTGKGRPSIYTPELTDRICELIATHPIGLVSLCELYPDLPSPSTIRKWIREPEKADFLHQYEIALEMRADLIFDELIDIADNPEYGRTTTTRAGVIEVTESDMIQHRRLKVDVRKWILSKLMPKKYGDSSQVKTSEQIEVYQPPVIIVKISKEVADKAVAISK
jgi:hypothetical protein